MFKIIKAKGVVRIPPEYFGEELDKIALEILKSEYQDKIFKDLGLVLGVLSAKASEEGQIIFGDGATYHEVEFELLTYVPALQEVVEGTVAEVDNYGIYVNLGPMDGLVHISQIADDTFKFDSTRGVLIGEKSKKVLQKGDLVRARIVTVSAVSSSGKLPRIGLTMKQPTLGKLNK
ncbi:MULTISPECIES: DNA-directed RNA polymerase [Acidianus]|uniref:DNA-directed RNA polymerase subunit Rpo7 n=2 Tax=Acidianus TaxID=12914 RepID=A0A650CXF9_ACIAM|nr:MULTISPECIES: DNA-directed RNA polymerase [Acidianus]MQL54704.1 DNA-directed RNA polymerase [Acidianus ambivalens]MUM64567.1 DNA-directed RNA polymerase [Acidianus infernus]QGR22503.1 DNA-directed RNA polymerase [Acidianus ambivalens]